jgi:hypothetical protein
MNIFQVVASSYVHPLELEDLDYDLTSPSQVLSYDIFLSVKPIYT